MLRRRTGATEYIVSSHSHQLMLRRTDVTECIVEATAII